MKGKIVIVVIVLALGAAAVWLFLSQNNTSSDPNIFRDFQIADADTVKIDRIFMADTYNQTIQLTKDAFGEWTVDGYKARQEPVHMLLETFSRMKVKAPVTKAARMEVIKLMAATHTKVEVYLEGEDKPHKIYYIGNPTKDHQGTFMLLEDADLGKSDEPFIVFMPGFNGFLSTRFHADILQWRYSGIFNYQVEEISSLSVAFNEEPENSYRIEMRNERPVLWESSINQQVERFDTARVYNYLTFYNKVHFEKFVRNPQEVNKDSILNSMPVYTISLEDRSGKMNELKIWRKANTSGELDAEGNPILYDAERMYGQFNDEDFVSLQNFHIDRLLVPIGIFRKAPAVLVDPI